MSINYEHKNNLHTSSGSQAALSEIFDDWKPNSLLDVGCGLGTWTKAAIDFGIADAFGVDGVDISQEQLFIDSQLFEQLDLTDKWNLNRRFDVVICLEVAEHLDSVYAENLIKTLTVHSDFVVFSAAPPWQSGQNHVNCQDPVYWQDIFNRMGFTCSDEIRWKLWEKSAIEPWYRQNLFIARYAPDKAGKENRIKAVIHPELLSFIETDFEKEAKKVAYKERVAQIENGVMPVRWYFESSFSSMRKKLERRVF